GVKGCTAVEADRIYALGRELHWLDDPSPQTFNVLVLLLLSFKFRGRMRSAQEIAEQLMQIAERLGNEALIMEAHRGMGSALIEQGKCTEALYHCDLAASLYETNRNHPYTLTIAHDCKIVCECFAARALCALGDADGALRRMQGALDFARELAHP